MKKAVVLLLTFIIVSACASKIPAIAPLETDHINGINAFNKDGIIVDKDGIPLNGYAVTLHENKSVASRKFFVNGRFTGTETAYRADGSVISDAHQVNETRYIKEYNDLGILVKESTLYQNKLDGLVVNYYNNGQVQSIIHYKQGLLDGPAEDYRPEGTLHTVYNYKNNLPDGITRRYRYDSSLMITLTYSEGTLISGVCTNRSGNTRAITSTEYESINNEIDIECR